MLNYRYDIEQNTPEWDEVRKGRITASNCADLLMKETAKGYQNLIRRVAFERLSGTKADSWQGNKYTDRGHELEDEARLSFEFETRKKVDVVGFAELDDWVGCSPDGLVSDTETVQIKCLDYKAHIDMLLTRQVEPTYLKQLQFELFVTGRKVNNLYFYHPNMNSILILVERDEEMIKEIKEKLEIAKKDVNNIIEKIKG